MTTALLAGAGLREFIAHSESMDGAWSVEASSNMLFEGFDTTKDGALRVAIPDAHKPHRLISQSFRPAHLPHLVKLTDDIIEEGLRAVDNPQPPWEKLDDGHAFRRVHNGSPCRHPGIFFVEPTPGTAEARIGSAVSLTHYIEPDSFHWAPAPFHAVTFEGPTPWLAAEKPPFAENFFTHRISVEGETPGYRSFPAGITRFHYRTELTFDGHPAIPFIMGLRFYYQGHLSAIMKNLGFSDESVFTQNVALAVLGRFIDLGFVHEASHEDTRFHVGQEIRWKSLKRFARVPAEDIQYLDVRGESDRSRTVTVRVHKAHPKITGDQDSLEIKIRLTPEDLERLSYRPLANSQLSLLNLIIRGNVTF